MIATSRPDGGAQAISFRVRNTIKSIREIVGDHSDADIYSVLRETNMDPNETAQRLLHQEPFHEVRRRRDKRKEVYSSQNAGYRKLIDTTIQRENKVHWAKPERSLDGIAKRGGYPRNPAAGIIQEFRVVKDKRPKQAAHKEVAPEIESFQDEDSRKEQVVVDILDKSSTGTLTDLKHSAARNEGQIVTAGNDKEIKPRSHHQLALPEDAQWTVSSPPVAQRGNQATQPNMEWKPKSIQKPSTVSNVDVIQSTSTADASDDQNQAEVVELTTKLSEANFSDDEHVIIPDHLRVPKSETIQLIFGSFEAGFDSVKGLASVSEAVGNSTESDDQPSVSMSASIVVIPSEKLSAVNQTAVLEAQVRIQSDSSLSTAECDRALPGNMGSSSPQNISNYGKSEFVTNHGAPYSSPNPLHLQVNASLPIFKAYEDHSQFEVPFLNSSVETNGTAQDMTFANEVMSSHPRIIGQMSATTAMLQQQQQPASQTYPQVHLPHFSNILPYRHVYSPVYVPPMAVPNYSSNPSYSHPSHGNSYLLMPNGNSHLTASGLKYASQYKPVFTGNPNGYGNYSNPVGYSASPGTIGSTPMLDDVNRIKYKDVSLYVPNPQAETSDIWIQTPRELPNMQSPPFFNLPGQAAAPHAAYLPIHNGHAPPYNAAAQASPVPYPGLHPSVQPASMALIPPSPHNLVPQQLPPALGGNAGVGVAAAATGAQARAFQQNQLSHLGWTASF